MKPILNLLTSAAMALALTGCFEEKYGFCPADGPDNVSLAFRLPDKDGQCTFIRDCRGVDVFIFDEEGSLAARHTRNAEELARFQGIKFGIEPGTYSVVCWTNVFDNTAYVGLDDADRLSEGYVTYADRLNGDVGVCDKVYYGPKAGGTRSETRAVPGTYVMTVDPETGHSGSMDFRSAHRSLEIYVEGYTGTPVIKIDGLPEALSHVGMSPLKDGDGNVLTVAAVQEGSPKEMAGKMYDYALFDAFMFGPDNDIVISVVNPGTGADDFSVSLAEATAGSENPDSIVVTIKITFSGGSVTVSLPDWKEQGTDPGFS